MAVLNLHERQPKHVLAWRWKRKAGYRMINKVASTFQVGVRVQCLANCTVSPTCDSYNYRPSDKTCQLNTHDTQHTLDSRLVVDLSFRQDVPAQHPRHSAHRPLGRHCHWQRLGLVAHLVHGGRLKEIRQTKDCMHSKFLHCNAPNERYRVTLDVENTIHC